MVVKSGVLSVYSGLSKYHLVEELFEACKQVEVAQCRELPFSGLELS